MKRQKMSSKEAINFVRKLRPYSIETWSQEECLEDYEKFLLTQNSSKDEERTTDHADIDWWNCD